jgi:hypothetical protein
MRITAVCLLAAATSLWAADPFAGAWKLNLGKSKFEPGPAPRSATMTWSETPGNTEVRTVGTRADGRQFQESYVPVYDSQEYKRPGPWNFDSVINRQVSEHEREDIFKRNGTVVGSSKLIVSPDGRTMTITMDFGAQHDFRFYDKQ